MKHIKLFEAFLDLVKQPEKTSQTEFLLKGIQAPAKWEKYEQE